MGIVGKAGPPNWCSSNQPSHNTPRASNPPPTKALTLCDVEGPLPRAGFRLIGLCGSLLAMEFSDLLNLLSGLYIVRHG